MSRAIKATLVALGLALAPGVAGAQARWIDGNFGFVPGLACVTANLETEVTTYAGYWGTIDTSFPRTGDVSYVRGVAAVVGNPCSGGDVLGFDFFLPAGASVAASAQTPVRCIATRLSDGFTTTTDPSIHCSQTPSAGTAGGLFFGYAVTPHGWVFEIDVPVRFDRALHGLASPQAEQLGVVTSTTNGPRAVTQFVTAPLRALVNYPSPSATFLGGSSYRVTSFVYNYFTAGTASIDAGTASGTYTSVGLAPANLPDTANGFSINTDLGLAPSFTGRIFWRTRFVTATGATFVGPEQSFAANGQDAQTRSIAVTKNGTGGGAVASDPQGLDCGATCTKSFTADTQVTLLATPAPGSQFSGWSGACAGAGPCVVTTSAAAAVTATFDVLPAPTIGSLDITPGGLPASATASIAVTGPGGFARTFSIRSGTGQSLSYVAPGQYDGMAADVVVGADTWVARPSRPSAAVLGGGKGVISTTYQLGRALTAATVGAGSVMSNPAGVACGAACTAYFADGEAVTLTAMPDAGMMFTGWSGACTGTGPCVVTVHAATAVTATFAAASPDPAPTPQPSGCAVATPGGPISGALVLLAGLALARRRRGYTARHEADRQRRRVR